MNLSTANDEATARTRAECALQRAENLAILGVKSVLELCVGPSLKTLETAYGVHGIEVTGNDIDPRWAAYYPKGKWLIGDCFAFDYSKYDAVVFAPPLSKGCSGKREDALSIDEVEPFYYSFTFKISSFKYPGIACMVLPARCWSTIYDRAQFHRLMSHIGDAEVIPLTSGPRKIRKYVDVYYRNT